MLLLLVAAAVRTVEIVVAVAVAQVDTVRALVVNHQAAEHLHKHHSRLESELTQLLLVAAEAVLR